MLTLKEFTEVFPQMVDLSCVQACHSKDEIDEMIDLAKTYRVAAVFAMPCYTPYIIQQVKQTESGISVGGVIGFPSGAATTSVKRLEARELRMAGCEELDMVMNQNAVKNGDYDTVSEDIRAVVEEAQGLPVKVILEVNNLSDEQIQNASKIVAASGAAFVKTGTGWHAKPTEVRHIALIHDVVQGDCGIKAAGGIRSIETAYTMYLNGCTRFGLSTKSFRSIICEISGIAMNK